MAPTTQERKTQISRHSSQVKMCLNTISTPSNLSQSAKSVDILTTIKGCENLSIWIGRLKAKEAILKNSRERDLRREVLVSKATQRAQEQLDLQRRLNLERWNEVKAKELEKCNSCFALKRFCSCSNTTIYMDNLECDEESKNFDDFFESLSSGKKRKQPSILKNCKRAKA